MLYAKLAIACTLLATCTSQANSDTDAQEGSLDAQQDECTKVPIATWLEGEAMPGRRESQAAVIADDRLYTLGGWWDGAGPVADAWYAPINAEAGLGNWETTASLPQSLQHHTAFSHGKWIYVLGGDNGASTYAATYVAPVLDGGGLGTWRETNAMPSPRTAHNSVVVDDRIVVFGGMTDFASFALTDSVISAELGPDGEIGVWETLQPLPAPRAWHGLALVDKAVFVIGGLVTTDGSLTVASDVVTSVVESNTLSWQSATRLPAPRFRMGVVTSGNDIVVMGGASGTGTAQVESFRTSLMESGKLGAWRNEANLPEARFAQASAQADGTVWQLGGFYADVQQQPRDTVYSTRLCD